MGILNFLKRKYWGSEINIEQLTPEFFAQQRTKMNILDYRKWLRRHYTLFGANALHQKEHKLSIRAFWIDRLEALERELEDVGNKIGKPQAGRKISEELRDYKKIIY